MVAAHLGNTRSNRFDLQVATSPTGPFTTVRAGAQTSGTTTGEEMFDFTDVTARYVRYLGHGNTDPTKGTWNSVSEISVFSQGVAGPTVGIQAMTFSPASLTVAAGATVTWVNNDTVTHTSTADGGAWDSGLITPGGSFSFTFSTAGTFPYHCNIHPGMTGTIVVTAPITPTPTPVPPTATPTPTPTSTPTPTPTATPVPVLVKINVPAANVIANTNDGNLPANTVDGSLATRWSGNGDGAWIQYDLGTAHLVSRVRIAVYNGNSRQNRFDLQVGNGGGVWTDVRTNALTGGTTTQLESFDFTATSVRYVRYVGHMWSGGTFNSLTEVEVWGPECTGCVTPTPPPTATPTPTPTPTSLTPTPTPTPTQPVSGTVYFQDTGTKQGWPNYPQDPQNLGRIDEVSSPVYKGTTALRFEQTYVKNSPDRFHSEVTYYHSEVQGQDRYYGFAMMLPTTWHNESVKDNFTQWGAENPGGPWLLMWIDQDHIKGGHPNTFGTTDFGAISKGVWHRIVFRLHMVSSPFEVWVDDTRRGAPSCTCGSTSSVRWSAGIYIAYWHDKYSSGLPAGSQTVRYLYQDHYRIASTFAAADPASW
jgi:plastocyanin